MCSPLTTPNTIHNSQLLVIGQMAINTDSSIVHLASALPSCAAYGVVAMSLLVSNFQLASSRVDSQISPRNKNGGKARSATTNSLKQEYGLRSTCGPLSLPSTPPADTMASMLLELPCRPNPRVNAPAVSTSSLSQQLHARFGKGNQMIFKMD